MIKIFSRNVLRFFLLVLIQVLVLNKIQMSGYINPFMYVLFILMLPFETPKWTLLMLAFLLGISIDIFSDSMGMHAAATVFMAFLRPFVLDLISPRDGYEIGSFPRLYYYGLPWFLRYSIILIVSHHIFLFYLEVFRMSDFFTTLWRVILSALFSLVLVLISQFLFYRKG